MNVIKHIMLSQSPSIQILPFLSNTNFLIESFLIIGYSPETIKQLTIDTSQTIITPPDIISFITNSNKTNQHFDSICKYVFPTQPEAYNHAHLKQKLLHVKSKFIFFFQEFNSNSTEQQRNNKNGCYTGFVYKFYETYLDFNNNTVFVPKAFCVLSRNCCFGFCNKLCELIYDKYQNGIDVIPMEVIIYNVVHFIPVPLKTHLNVDFELLLTCRNETSFRSTISTTYSDNISRRFSMESSFKYMVEQLSGYPKFQFCIYDILRVVPYKNLVEIVLYMLFEFNVFFFSKHVDILNNVMYICSMLLYPLTDTHLIGEIVSVSDNEFINVCSHCDKNKSFIMGVNASFAKWKMVMNVLNFDKFIFVDLDSKQVFTCVQIRSRVRSLSDVDMKVDDETKQIVEIVSRLSNKKKVGCSQLDNAMHRLINSLSDFCKRNAIKETQSHSYLTEGLFTYDITKNIHTLNLELQGIFYVGVISFIKFFYQLYSTTINENFGDFSDQSNDPVIVNEVDNVKLSKEEKVIISSFNKTMLCDRYIKFFLKKRQLIDNYHFPFIFMDELIQAKYFVDHNLQSTKDFAFGKGLLLLIDKVYSADNYSQICEIDFSEFISFCQKEQLKEMFMYGLNESKIYIKKPKGGECVFKVKHIELDEDILFKYSYALCNVDSLSKLFPSINTLHHNDTHSISSIEIESAIESHLTFSQETKTKDIILSIYYNLLACIAEKVDLQCQFTAISSTFPLYGFSCRKAFNILLTIYNDIIQRKFQSKQPIQDEIEHLNKLLHCFVSNGNLPNEAFVLLMKRLLLLKKMQSIDLGDKNVVNKKEKQVNDVHKDVQFDLFCDDPNVKKREIKNYILKQIEHTVTETNLSIPGKSNKSLDVKSVWLSVSLAKKDHKILSSIYSPVKLYKKVHTATTEYISTGKRDVFTKDKFETLISMLMFYMHYIEDLKKVSFEPFVKYLNLG